MSSIPTPLPEPLATAMRLLRASLTARLTELKKMTEQSRRYRLKASELACLSEATLDIFEQLELVRQALAWIELATNDERLAA